MLPKIRKLFLVAVDHGVPVANLLHDGFKSILKGPVAKVDDLATRYSVVLAVVELIGILAGWENNMMSGEEEDPVTLTAFTDIKTTCSLKMREGLGGYPKTKRRSERDAYVNCGVDRRDMVEELRSGSDVPGVDRLAECNLDVGDRILQEELLAVHSRGFGMVRGESAR